MQWLQLDAGLLGCPPARPSAWNAWHTLADAKGDLAIAPVMAIGAVAALDHADRQGRRANGTMLAFADTYTSGQNSYIKRPNRAAIARCRVADQVAGTTQRGPCNEDCHAR